MAFILTLGCLFLIYIYNLCQLVGPSLKFEWNRLVSPRFEWTLKFERSPRFEGITLRSPRIECFTYFWGWSSTCIPIPFMVVLLQLGHNCLSDCSCAVEVKWRVWLTAANLKPGPLFTKRTDILPQSEAAKNWIQTFLASRRLSLGNGIEENFIWFVTKTNRLRCIFSFSSATSFCYFISWDGDKCLDCVSIFNCSFQNFADLNNDNNGVLCFPRH